MKIRYWVWMNEKGNPANNYYDYLKANAATLIGGTTFNKALYNGVLAGGNTATLSYNVEMLLKLQPS